jgi:muramoyltetrapeptide carboxypeptidase
MMQHLKPFVGYSDITALHALLQSVGLVRFHAPMPASGLVIDGAEDDAAALCALLMHPLPAGRVFAPALLPGAWHVGGIASGRLVGGNLSLMASLCGTPWAIDARGAILFIEKT